MAPMKEYIDSDFGYSIQYPCFFQQEEKPKDDYLGHVRFSYTDTYKPALPRLFKLIDDWKVLGAN